MCVLPLEWQEAMTYEREIRIAFQVGFMNFETPLTLPRGLSCLWEAEVWGRHSVAYLFIQLHACILHDSLIVSDSIRIRFQK